MSSGHVFDRYSIIGRYPKIVDWKQETSISTPKDLTNFNQWGQYQNHRKELLGQ
jgi:hypothetical protein